MAILRDARWQNAIWRFYLRKDVNAHDDGREAGRLTRYNKTENDQHHGAIMEEINSNAPENLYPIKPTAIPIRMVLAIWASAVTRVADKVAVMSTARLYRWRSAEANDWGSVHE